MNRTPALFHLLVAAVRPRPLLLQQTVGRSVCFLFLLSDMIAFSGARTEEEEEERASERARKGPSPLLFSFVLLMR